MVISRDTTQVLKGIAIIMIVISHIRYIYDFGEGLEKIFNPCGYLGVSLFLMLSGYGCAISSSRNTISTLIKRVRRVVIPLAICTLSCALVMIATHTPPLLDRYDNASRWIKQ